jgi:hypothetical protein
MYLVFIFLIQKYNVFILQRNYNAVILLSSVGFSVMGYG